MKTTWRQLNRNYTNYRPATLEQIIAIAFLAGLVIGYALPYLKARIVNAATVKMTATVPLTKDNCLTTCVSKCK